MKTELYIIPTIKPDLSIETPPAKIIYQAGERFDPSGMVVSGTDRNGNFYILDEFNVISGFEPLKQGETSQTMYIVAGDDIQKIVQPITVVGSETYCDVGVMSHRECEGMFREFLGAGSKLQGSDATITAICNDGFKFVGWFDADENALSVKNPYTFRVEKDIVCYAKAKVIK